MTHDRFTVTVNALQKNQAPRGRGIGMLVEAIASLIVISPFAFGIESCDCPERFGVLACN